MVKIVCSNAEYDIIQPHLEKLVEAYKSIPEKDGRLDIIMENISFVVTEEPKTNADVLLEQLIDSLDTYAYGRVDQDLTTHEYVGDFRGSCDTLAEAVQEEIKWLNSPVEVNKGGNTNES